MPVGSAPPPGWYPDPHVAGGYRWWDGSGWTSHVSSPAPQPAPTASAPQQGAEASPTAPAETTPRPPRRRKRVVLISAITVGVVAVAAGLAFGLPPLLSGGPTATEPVVVNGYTYEVPLGDVAPDHTFAFAVEYELDEVVEDRTGPADGTGAFEVYTDPALTHHAEVQVSQLGDEVRVAPSETQEANQASDEILESQSHRIHNDPGDAMFTWGLYETYYLVQYLDETGTALERPSVTQFSIDDEAQLDPVEARFTASDEAGNVMISWDAVDGASEYLVVTSTWDARQKVRQYQVAGSTADTAWSSAESTTSFDDDVIDVQNAGLDLYETSADSTTTDSPGPGGDVTPREPEVGVIATDGTAVSPYRTNDADAFLGPLPHRIATEAADESFSGDTYDSLAAVPAAIPYTSLDGQTRQGAAQINADEVETTVLTTRHSDGTLTDEEVYQVEVRALGTNLSYPVRVASIPDLDAGIGDFNARALHAAPKAGAIVLSTADAAAANDAPVSTSAPDTPYEVVGTNDLTRYLAANLLDHQEAIDVTEYDGLPGTPEIWDAFDEAKEQNPYVLGDVEATTSDGIVYVSYALPEDEFRQRQEEVSDIAASIVAETTSDDMDATATVTALNDWLVDNGEYDYEAFERSENGFGGIPEGYESAWRADGLLLDGTGVCASYADALNVLVREAGIDSVRVTGDLADGAAHAWNKVEIDDRWLAVDTTWNDSDPANGYLLVGDDEFTGNAARSEGRSWISDQHLGDYATD